MRDVTKEAKLILAQPFTMDGVYYPAGMFISLPEAAFRLAFQDEPSFLEALHTKAGGAKRGRKPKVKETQ